MKRQRHTEEQIIQVLNEALAGAAIDDLCRRRGISQATCYKLEAEPSGARRLPQAARRAVPEGAGNFGSLQVSDSRLLRVLEDENRKLKKLVADRALDMMVLKELLQQKS